MTKRRGFTLRLRLVKVAKHSSEELDIVSKDFTVRRDLLLID